MRILPYITVGLGFVLLQRAAVADDTTVTTTSDTRVGDTSTLETSQPDGAHSEPTIGWNDLLARDLAGLGSLADGSAVAVRARAAVERRSQESADEAELQRVFRATQTGPFDLLIADAARRWGLDPFLLRGLLMNESRLDPKLIGKRLYRTIGGKRTAVGGGARGIAQFTGDGVSAVNEYRRKRHLTGEQVAVFTSRDVMDPEVAIPAAAELLSWYIARFGRDGGVTAYNSGPYGGRLVKRLGFHKARRTGKLSRVGRTQLQGHRFLLNVLKKTNKLRKGAGLEPLPGPGKRPARGKGRGSRRHRPNS